MALTSSRPTTTKVPVNLGGFNPNSGAIPVAPQQPQIPSFQAFSQQQTGSRVQQGSPYTSGVVQQGVPTTKGGTVAPIAAVPATAATAPLAQGVPTVQGAPVPTLTNVGAVDPQIQAAIGKLAARTEQQQGKEGAVDPNLQTQIGRLDERLSTDTTQRAVDRATGRARSAAAGMQGALSEDLARRGVSGGGYEGRRRSQISDAAARATAKAAADIEMGELARKDALVLGGQQIMAAPGQERLTREGQTNALVKEGVSAAEIPARLGLEQQGLGLRQYEAQNRANTDQARLALEAQQGATNTDLAQRRQMLSEFEAMLRASGY